MSKKIWLTLPNDVITAVLQKNNLNFILLKNTEYFFLVKLKKNTIFFIDRWVNSITIILDVDASTEHKLLISKINLFFSNWNNFNFEKIKFTGKGYKLDKYYNRYYFFFNYSHIKLLKTINLVNFRLKKQKLFFISKGVRKFTNLMRSIINLRYINKYTKRGLRLSRMHILVKNKRKK